MASVVSWVVSCHQQRHDVTAENLVVGVQHSVQHSDCLLQEVKQLNSVVHAATHCCQVETKPLLYYYYYYYTKFI